MLEGGSLGKFDFEVTDFFLFGSPLGLVLALRKTVVPTLDGEEDFLCSFCFSWFIMMFFVYLIRRLLFKCFFYDFPFAR